MEISDGLDQGYGEGLSALMVHRPERRVSFALASEWDECAGRMV